MVSVSSSISSSDCLDASVSSQRSKLLIVSKRGFENFHVFFWALKDLAWIRCWPNWFIFIMITILLSTTIYSLIADIYVIYKIRASTKDKIVLYKSYREVINTMGMLIWLTGNCVWCYYETTDLRVTATYGDYYLYGIKVITPMLITAAGIEVLFHLIVVYCEFFCISTWFEEKLSHQKGTTGRKSSCDFEYYIADEHMPRVLPGFNFISAAKRMEYNEAFQLESGKSSTIKCNYGFFNFRDFEFRFSCGGA